MKQKRKKVLNKPKKASKPLKKEWIFVVFFLFLGTAFRIIHLQSIEKNDPTFYNLPYGTDMVTYDNYAKNILQGKHPVPFFYNPLYPYFLSIIYLFFGPDLYIARLIQMIIGVLTLFFIFLVGDRVFGRKAAIISLGLASFYDMFILHESLLLLETLAGFLNIISLFFLLKIEKEPCFKNIFLSGLFLGLSTISRANILLFLPFIFLWMIFVLKKKAILSFSLLSLFTLLFISPVTIANYCASGKFLLVSGNGPINLWVGNNERADGTYAQPPFSPKLEKRIKEIGDKALIEDVIRFIKEKPKMFINLTIRKFFLFWGAFEIANNMNYEQMKSWSSIMKLPFFIGFGTIGPLALFGIFLSLRKRECLLLNLYILSFTISTIIFSIMARHKIVFLPSLIIFSSFSILWFYEKILKMDYKKILLLFPVFLFSFLLVWNKEVYSSFFPFIHPEGIHIQEKGYTIIKDASNDWRGGNAVIFSDKEAIKKEIIITEDLSLYKEAEIGFKYCLDEFPGILTIKINDSFSLPLRLGMSTQGLVKGFGFSIPIKSLKKGKNSIILSVDGKSHFGLLYDTTYTFKRSYEFKDNNFRKIKQGEFMLWLLLKQHKEKNAITQVK